jgi:hypothetical protein
MENYMPHANDLMLSGLQEEFVTPRPAHAKALRINHPTDWVSKKCTMRIHTVFRIARIVGATPLLVAAATLICSSQLSSAAVLALYPFTGSSTASTDADASSSAGNFTDGAGFASGTSFGTANDAGDTLARTVNGTVLTAGSAAAAITGNDYFQFVVTAGAMNLTSLTFTYEDSSSGTGDGIFVRSSVNGFTTDLFTDTISMTKRTANINLTGAAFQGISTVTFRVYIWDTSTSTAPLHYVDDVTLNGTATAVPEPTGIALGLFGLGFVGVGIGRRCWCWCRK